MVDLSELLDVPEFKSDEVEDERLLDDNGRLCFADRGKSNRPPLFRLLFNGGIVVQQAILIYLFLNK